MRESAEKLRIYGEPDTVRGFSFVTLHPLADEVQVLDWLSMLPINCDYCDLYWQYRARLFFVSIASLKDKKPFVSYHFKENSEDGFSFYVVTHERSLTKLSVERALQFLAGWVNNHEILLKKEVSSPLIITNEDICKHQL